jgi:hypothetical protein
VSLQWTLREDTTLHCNRTRCVDGCNTTSVSVLAARFINRLMQPVLGRQSWPAISPPLRTRASQSRQPSHSLSSTSCAVSRALELKTIHASLGDTCINDQS